MFEGAAAEAHDVAGPDGWPLALDRWPQLLLFESVDDRGDVEAPGGAVEHGGDFVDGVHRGEVAVGLDVKAISDGAQQRRGLAAGQRSRRRDALQLGDQGEIVVDE